MSTEDTVSSPPVASPDEKEAHKVPDHPHKNGTLKATHQWTGFEKKTVWDWLQLLGVLAIPLVVAGATLLFSIQQANLAQQQHATDQKIADQQREADKQSALDQQEAMILQTYLDNIQDLLLNHKLLGSKPNDDVAILARARTLTALRGLDQQRKGLLIQFLHEAKLIGFRDTTGTTFNRTINLYGANLTAAILSSANLSSADLRGAALNGAWHLTQQQLDQVDSCMGARLPQGLLCHHNQ
jgi:Pentapeptide repeats (8 copies)